MAAAREALGMDPYPEGSALREVTPEGRIPGPRPEYLEDEYYYAKGLDKRPEPPAPPRGIYLHGGVGVGKSLCMDLLFQSTEGLLENRRRVHFQSFMVEVFREMHAYHQEVSKLVDSIQGDSRTYGIRGKPFSKAYYKKRNKLRAHHPLKHVSEKLVGGRKLLFLSFDEFQLNDIATTRILRGLFERLYKNGVVVVATGNRAPTDMGRFFNTKQEFEGFLSLWRGLVDFEVLGGETDYRYLQTKLCASNLGLAEGKSSVDAEAFPAGFPFFTGDSASVCLAESIKVMVQSETVTAEASVSAATVATADLALPQNVLEAAASSQLSPRYFNIGFGRQLLAPLSSIGGTAVFAFEDLCCAALGPADFIAIARQFHTLFVADVPQMSLSTRDQARRFISLVDELYNHGTRLVVSSEVEAEKLFDGSTDPSEAALLDVTRELQFDRMPMRADEATSTPGQSPDGGPVLKGEGMVELKKTHTLFTGEDERFAFSRAVSRLAEMRSASYIARRPAVPVDTPTNAEACSTASSGIGAMDGFRAATTLSSVVIERGQQRAKRAGMQARPITTKQGGKTE